MGTFRFVAIVLCLLCSLGIVVVVNASPVLAQEAFSEQVILVLDGSGSMKEVITVETLEGITKIDLAVKAVVDTASKLQEEGIGVELLVFQGEGCYNLPSVSSAWSRWNRELDPDLNIVPNGSTPTGRALQAAMYKLGYIDEYGLETGTGSGQIILISDGLSNCPPAPCEVVKNTDTKVVVHTVGFLLADEDEEAEEELRCIAKESGGVSVNIEKIEEAERQIARTVLVRNVHNHPKNVPDDPDYFTERYPWWRYPDRDIDGIPDKWEEEGVYFITIDDNGVVGERWLDLPGYGADPDRKDLFIYYDWEEGAALHRNVIGNIEDAFLAAPLDNVPGSLSGVRVHFIRGGRIPPSVLPDSEHTKEGNNFLEMFRIATEHSGFDRSMWAGSPRVPQLAKYLLLRPYDCPQTDCVLGTARGVPENYAVTYKGLELLLCQDYFTSCPSGSVLDAAHFWQATTIMHELGHLLGLHHHGKEACPRDDPDYKSIMSYAYSSTGVPTWFGPQLENRIDYARDNAVNLDWKTGTTGGSPFEDPSKCGWYQWLLPSPTRHANAGSLTFVLGQFGEDPEFYVRPYGLLQSGDKVIVREKGLSSRMRASSPEALELFADTFGLGAVRPEILDPCDAAPPSPFLDVLETGFAFRDVACIYNLGITAGTGPVTYAPEQLVTREQMAAFLARLHWAVNFTPPCIELITQSPPFVDLSPTSFAFDDVSCIYNLDVTRGTGLTTYSPYLPVTREQMAAFLSRLYRAVTGTSAPLAKVPFVDTGSSFARQDIQRIFGLDVTRGTSPTTFSPRDPVTREQMAAFLARLYRVVDAENQR